MSENIYKLAHDDIKKLISLMPKEYLMFSDSLEVSLNNSLVYVTDNLSPLSTIDKVNNIQLLSVLQNSVFSLEKKMQLVQNLKTTCDFYDKDIKLICGDLYICDFDLTSDRESTIENLFLQSQTKHDLTKNIYLFQVSLELLMNAQIDAPKLATIQNPKKSILIFEKNEKENLFAISVIDHYGSLKPEKMIQQIYKALQFGFLETMSRKSYGAGLGSAIIFDHCDSMYIGVDPNKVTRVSVILPFGLSNNKMSQIQKSLYIHKG